MLMAAISARRMTKDADLSTRGVGNEEEQVAAVVGEILASELDVDDGLEFDADSIRTEVVREDAEQHLLARIIGDTTRAVWSDYGAAVAGHEKVTDRLRAAAEVYALRHATHPREAMIVNRDVSALHQSLRSEVVGLRRRHERAIRELIQAGCRQHVFSVSAPALASFGILELCVSIAHWFRADGPLSAQEVAAQYAEFAVRIATG